MPATKVVWETASGTLTEGPEGRGWYCDACHRPFCEDDGESRQKRKLRQHVNHRTEPCTRQTQARATRSIVANTVARPFRGSPLSRPASNQTAMLGARHGWTLTKPPCKHLRETWSKHLGPGESWVFVLRKAFDPTSAQEWFKDPDNEPKVYPHGPWETVDGGRLQHLWAADGRYGAGPCEDFYNTVNKYLGREGECREYLYAQVRAGSLVVQVFDCVCCCRQARHQSSNRATWIYTCAWHRTAASCRSRTPAASWVTPIPGCWRCCPQYLDNTRSCMLMLETLLS